MLTWVASPKLGWKMKRQKNPVTIGAIAHGSSNATASGVSNRDRLFISSAVASANGMVSTVVPTANQRVRGMESTKNESLNIRVMLSRPRNLVGPSLSSSIR